MVEEEDGSSPGGIDAIDPTAFIAPGAVIVGDVAIGAESSVWFGAVLRGDLEPIRIGAGSNIQDLSVMHTDAGFPTIVGDRVTVGHRAIIHGAVIDDGCLIGMGSIVLTGARVGAGALVAAGAVVREGFEVPPGMLAAGVPARIVRDLDPDEKARLVHGASSYIETARQYRLGRVRVRP